MAGTLVKDPATGAYNLAPGADAHPASAVLYDPIAKTWHNSQFTDPTAASRMIPVSDYGVMPTAVAAPVDRSIQSLGVAPTGSSAANPAPNQQTAPVAPGDAYKTFASNLMGILSKAQQVGDPTALLKSREQLTNQSLNLSNPMNDTPYKSLFGMMSPEQSLAAQGGTQKAFQPGLTSITDQINAGNQALGNFNEAVKTAYDVNKPLEVSAGSSLVTPGGDVLHQGARFTPTFNYQTGMMDGFDAVTGTWASDQAKNAGMGGSSGVGGSASPGPLIAGVDFTGASTSTQPYATDPNYVSEVAGTYKAIQQQMPEFNPTMADQYIKSHAPKSPLTAQMILNASSTYQIDPTLLMAQLAHESDFGTAGVAVRTQNPGNVGNTDSGATQNYASWQAGTNAAAREIARRMPGNPNANKAPTTASTNITSTMGAQFSSDASTRVAQLPEWMQKYTDAGPKGVAYINIDAVPANQKDAVGTFGAKVGIPRLDSIDVKNLKAIQQVYEQVNNINSAVNAALQPGTTGRVYDYMFGPISEFLQTDWGRQLAKIDSYRTTAISAVQALNGGAGSGLRINTGEIMANTKSFLPTGQDSIEGALIGLNQLTQYLDTQLRSTFPYAPTTAALTGKTATGGTSGGSSGVTPGGISYQII